MNIHEDLNFQGECHIMDASGIDWQTLANAEGIDHVSLTCPQDDVGMYNRANYLDHLPFNN